jgi:hypothetical protein
MKKHRFIYFYIISAIVVFTSCSTLEKASIHGLTSGYYKLNYENQLKNVYVDATDEKIEVYNQSQNSPDKNYFLSIPLNVIDSSMLPALMLSKQSLDVDITTILLKYRPSVYGLPPQLTSDINVALYSGWRHDTYKIKSRIDPLERSYYKITSLGYDFGFFAGPEATSVNPFTTNNRTANDYSGVVFQTGIAGFIETNWVSFGVAAGLDYLLNSDRDIWIYNNKPWFGFIVGIALY